MSYHDKKLIAASKHAKRRSGRFVTSFVEGFGGVSLYAPASKVKHGSLADDWRAVGNDMRKAMARVNAGE